MSIIDDLAALQEQDIRLRDMNAEVDDIPKRQKLEQTRLDKHKEELQAAEAALKAVQATAHELELEVASREEKISKLRGQQLDLKTNKEFKAMDDEIASVQKDMRGIEDKELLLMEDIEKARGDVAARQKDLADEESAVSRDVVALDGRVGELKSELASIQAERDEIAEKIDPEWRKRYESIFERKDKAVVEVSNGICGGCNMKLPPAVIHTAGSRKEMIFCDFCGRMLR